MHMTRAESADLARALVGQLRDGRHRYLVAPSFTNIETVAAIVRGTNIGLGAQNCAPEEQGAHTGEVSVLQLKDLGVRTVILGHSERRHVYGETDGLVNKKVRLALKHGFEVILCIGELESEREEGRTEQVCEAQARLGLEGVTTEELANVVIAYEPVWAIGTGKTATPEDANAVHAFVRGRFAEWHGREAAERLIIQYGGSVKAENAARLMAMEHIDGALVGGASLKPESFVPIAKFS